jgi:hypothetical protein
MANGDGGTGDNDRRKSESMNCDTVMEKLIREIRDRCLRYDNTVDGTRLNADLAVITGAILAILKTVKT